jgi:hypothetical protein
VFDLVYGRVGLGRNGTMELKPPETTLLTVTSAAEVEFVNRTEEPD